MSLDEYDDDILIERLEADGYLVVITRADFQDKIRNVHDNIDKSKREGDDRRLKCYRDTLRNLQKWYDEDSIRMLEEIKSRGFTITDRYGREV